MVKVRRLKTKCNADIDGDMTVYNAMALKEELVPLLEEPRELAIKLANVTEIDMYVRNSRRAQHIHHQGHDFKIAFNTSVPIEFSPQLQGATITSQAFRPGT